MVTPSRRKHVINLSLKLDGTDQRHSREGGNPNALMDPRLRDDDKGQDSRAYKITY